MKLTFRVRVDHTRIALKHFPGHDTNSVTQLLSSHLDRQPVLVAHEPLHGRSQFGNRHPKDTCPLPYQLPYQRTHPNIPDPLLPLQRADNHYANGTGENTPPPSIV